MWTCPGLVDAGVLGSPSIVLDADLIARLSEKGAKRGLGQQTTLKMIVREHFDEYGSVPWAYGHGTMQCVRG